MKDASKMNTRDIKRELAKKDHELLGVFPLMNKKPYSFSYPLTYPLTTNMGEVAKIKTLGYLRVTWERSARKTGLTQML